MFGTFSKFSSPQLVEMLGYVGMDFIIVEGEHGACSYGEMENFVQAGNGVGMSAVVRVPNALDQNILHAGDMGAQGMQIPNLHNAAEAAEAVRKMRYYPKGSRDFAMTTRAADYKNQPSTASTPVTVNTLQNAVCGHSIVSGKISNLFIRVNDRCAHALIAEIRGQ